MAERPMFIDQLRAKWDVGKFVCVGLDPDWKKLPVHLAARAREDEATNFNIRYEATLEFLSDIVSVTHDLVAAYKPNIAFYEDRQNAERALAAITRRIHQAYPDIPVIGDVKRADIGNTNEGYARMAYDRYGFDAITTNPYFGHDTYDPFLKYPGKGLFVLCKTSNPGAQLYQDAPVHINHYYEMQKQAGTPLSDKEFDYLTEAGRSYSDKMFRKGRIVHGVLPLHRIIALRTATLSAEYGNSIGLVVGATQAEDFDPIRCMAPDIPLLIPGIGRQGGDLEKTLRYAPDSKGQGMIINSSSGTIFASSGEDFADAARAATLKLHNQITDLRRAA